MGWIDFNSVCSVLRVVLECKYVGCGWVATRSTAQRGGGNFKNRNVQVIGGVGCCNAAMHT